MPINHIGNDRKGYRWENAVVLLAAMPNGRLKKFYGYLVGAPLNPLWMID